MEENRGELMEKKKKQQALKYSPAKTNKWVLTLSIFLSSL